MPHPPPHPLPYVTGDGRRPADEDYSLDPHDNTERRRDVDSFSLNRGADGRDVESLDQPSCRTSDAVPSHYLPLHSVPVQNLAFLVIREDAVPLSSPSPSPEPRLVQAEAEYRHDIGPGRDQNQQQGNMRMANATPADADASLDPPCCPVPALEHTQSGLSISSSASASDSLLLYDAADPSSLSDLAAARLVRQHLASFRRRSPDSQSERILRALIAPKSRGADFPLDNDALRSIFSAANELFFASRLACRVAWDWSHPDSGQYENHIVGTTALRRCVRLGGWETLIVLSSPILRDNKYNRRLLISTFLHEMIHSYMFVMCGTKASKSGGHTDGFRQIAAMIDDWAGREYLRMSDMEADLERFRDHDRCLDVEPAWHDYDAGGRYLMPPLPPLPHSSHEPSHRRQDDQAQGEWRWNGHEDFGPYPSASSYLYSGQ
ncbi:putative metallopeptidase [Drechmeria coniospora]|uniref:Putative metallopeptidase n=1 Tax=Drechmeria coniospora TaxID=98403 RepID=A0A151GC65_DRECN|nr:putative metallopeptidase [Drechmeria coniospora]KYK54635.1 putative metallopeptidase [Drechmeria coniospora]